MSELVPQIRAALANTAKLLAAGTKLLAVLRCPADALITDGQGGAIGVRAGQPINTIPGATVLSDQGAKIYLLPNARTYSVVVSRTGAGDIGFDVLRAAPGGKLGLVSYSRLPIAPGGAAQINIAADGATTSARVGGNTIAPSLTGLSEEIKAAARPSGGPAALPPAAPTPAAAPGKSFVLASSSQGIVFTDDYPHGDFDVEFEVTCVQPGTIFDTMGLNIAPTGSWSVLVTADNHLAFNLWDGQKWSTLNSQATISRGKATKVRLLRRGPTAQFFIGGKPDATASLPTPLSGKPIYVGDFKGDEQWGAAHRIHQGLVGTVRVLYLGNPRP